MDPDKELAPASRCLNSPGPDSQQHRPAKPETEPRATKGLMDTHSDERLGDDQRIR